MEEAGPCNSASSLEQSLGFASETFDPLRVLYTQNLGNTNENVEIYSSVLEFMRKNNLQSAVRSVNSSDELLVHTKSLPSRTTSTTTSNPASVGTELLTPDKEERFGKDLLDLKTKVCGQSVSQFNTGGDIKKKCHLSQTKLDENLETMVTEKEQGKSSVQPRNRKGVPRRTVLSEMNEFQQGPLSILRLSVQEKKKVRVWTRSVRNVRGISTGYIVAFDKHMNLAMMDVDEIYRKPIGKHQKKLKRPEVASMADISLEDKETNPCYPKTPWQLVTPDNTEHPGTVSVDISQTHGTDTDCSDQSSRYSETIPADGIGDLPSAFSGMHVFEETETTRLLGTRSRRVLSRHLNQVLLRGDHVVAVALVD